MTKDGQVLILSIKLLEDPQLDFDSDTEMVQIEVSDSGQNLGELSPTFRFFKVSQVGNQCLVPQVNPPLSKDPSLPALVPDTVAVVWPQRILQKHDISQQSDQKIIT